MEIRMTLDWFESAEVFKKKNDKYLCNTVCDILEHFDIPIPKEFSENIDVKPLEIPGIYKVLDDYEGYSGFRFFMDGIQRTVLWQYYNFNGTQIPIYLHFSGAAIMERVKADLFRPFDEIYARKILVPSFLFEELQELDDVVDSGAGKYWDLNELRVRAKIKSKMLRQDLELELVNRFNKNSDIPRLLIKDGNILGTARKNNVLGLIKTHQTLYLQKNFPRIQKKVWNMDEFYRSSVFTIRHKDKEGWKNRTNSFYLRIHPPLHPEMGLIRIEYNNAHNSANEISSWLIAERAIIAACNRWDRQIYPIQMCEDYLRTQLPSFNFIKAKINSMGM
tara:strand:+ start:1655 stop:2656 length:1002 start_codon:yes stop_codon:yes gene_type:complete